MGNGWENFPQEDSDKNMIRNVKNFDLVPGDLGRHFRRPDLLQLWRCYVACDSASDAGSVSGAGAGGGSGFGEGAGACAGAGSAIGNAYIPYRESLYVLYAMPLPARAVLMGALHIDRIVFA